MLVITGSGSGPGVGDRETSSAPACFMRESTMAPENHPNRLLASLSKADFELILSAPEANHVG